MQRRRGLELGRPFGPPLLIHRSWFGAGALLIVHLAFTTFGGEPFVGALALGAAVSAGLFLSLLVHEGAHSVARRWSGFRTMEVTLFPFGEVSRVVGGAHRAGAQISEAVAGPLASALLGFVVLRVSSSVGGSLGEAVWLIAISNLALAGANLIPASPLDGGRLLAGFLWQRGRDRAAAVRLTGKIGQAFGLALVAAGIWLGVGNMNDATIVALALWMLVFGAFIGWEATTARRAAGAVVTFGDGTAGSWARPFAGRVRAENVVPLDGGPYAVSDGDRLAGILMPSTLLISRGRRASEVMIPWTPEIALEAETPVASVVERLAGPGPGVVIVLENGVVRGVIDADSVRARLGVS